MDVPLLSIAIPTFDRLPWLKKCLGACLTQVEELPAGTVEVVVSDNAGSDGSWAYLQTLLQEHSCLRVRRNAANVGCQNFNVVVQEAKGQFVWLMGDDDAPRPGGVARVVELLRTQPRDIYLLHCQEVDRGGRPVTVREWFRDLPRQDWNLADRTEFMDYLQHAQYMAGAFGFISVLVVDREAWLGAGEYLPEFSAIGWPHVARVLQMIGTGRGRVRVVPEVLLDNTVGNDGSEENHPWDRAMWDLRGWLRLAEVFWPEDPEQAGAFLGPLRRNRQSYFLHHFCQFAPSRADWEEAKRLMLRAGIDAMDIGFTDRLHRMAQPGFRPPKGLDPEALCLADAGLVARGARRIALLVGEAARPELDSLLDLLRSATRAEFRLLQDSGTPLRQWPEVARTTAQAVDLVRLTQDRAYQAEAIRAMQAFAPDLVLNLDAARRPAWDLLVLAAGAVAALAFQAVDRTVPVEVGDRFDAVYTRLLPTGPWSGMVSALGLGAMPEAAAKSEAAAAGPGLPPESPLKLNLGCGQDHLPGWVNVDQFAASKPDLVHDLERFPWPFPDGCAEEVLLKHVLEHLGRDSGTFLGIIKELYRVCAPGARVRILVPHPRHQDFLQDPTHVRPVLPEMFQHFSLDCNRDWTSRGLPGTPLALYLGVDFQTESVTLQLDPWWDAEYRAGRVSREQLERALRDCNNVVQASEIRLRARKPFRGEAPASGALPLCWEGALFIHHSLAHVNRQLCLGLLGSGQVDLGLVPYGPNLFDGAAMPAYAPLAERVGRDLPDTAVHVRHQWPPRFDPPAQGPWVIIQPWEYGGIPGAWVEPMRDRVDEIWVPSSWVKDCYVQSGIPEGKVVVVPNGVDTAVFSPEGQRYPLRTTKGCRFLFVGGTGLPRKGFDLLLAAYLRSFRAGDDVCLVVKDQGSGVYENGGFRATLERIRREDPEAPEIECVADDLAEPAMAALYRGCDALVLPYRGEGFGLPIAEAMASGLPVIVTGAGASRDFVREDWAYPVPSHRLPMADLPFGLAPSRAGYWLEEPDGEALAQLMRQAFEHPEERRAKGRKAREYAQAELGWDKPVRRILERLAELAGRRPCRLTPAPAAPAVPEALLFRPDWASNEWVEILLSYLLAFKPGEPVALVLPWAGVAGEPPLEEVQARVVGFARNAGMQQFPDVALVDRAEDLDPILGRYPTVTPVPPGRDAADRLESPAGQRLAAMRRRLRQPK